MKLNLYWGAHHFLPLCAAVTYTITFGQVTGLSSDPDVAMEILLNHTD